MNKIVIIGAGEIAKNALTTVFRIFPRDKVIDIVLFNRTKEKADIAYLDTSLEKDDISFLPNLKAFSSKFRFKTSSELVDLQGAEVIIFTIGVTAASLGSSTREFALPFVYKLVTDYADHIKKYAPESFVLVITNPVDITTWIMQEKTGFPPKRVLGFGCDLDSRRFIRSFREELNKIGIDTQGMHADVIGGHSEKDMIIPNQSIIIDGLTFDQFKMNFSDQSGQIDLAFKIADQKMREEGFRIVKAGFKAGLAPTSSLVVAAKSILFGGEAHMTCSQLLTSENDYFGITDSCISVPVVINFKDSKICHDKYTLSGNELTKLIEVSNKHQLLFNDIKSMPNDLLIIINRGLDDMKAQTRRSNGALSLYQKGIAKMNESTVDLLQVGKSDTHSEITLEFKKGFESLSHKSKLNFLSYIADYFIENGIKNLFSLREEPGRESIILQNKREVIEVLQDIGIMEKSRPQSRL